jgi:hypothetical protein
MIYHLIKDIFQKFLLFGPISIRITKAPCSQFGKGQHLESLRIPQWIIILVHLNRNGFVKFLVILDRSNSMANYVNFLILSKAIYRVPDLIKPLQAPAYGEKSKSENPFRSLSLDFETDLQCREKTP